jgi:hypothetical protein
MLGNPREVTEHALRIKPGSKPVQQRLRLFSEDKRKVIDEEIAKLLVAGFMKEVYHPEWLANPVLVKKKSGKWRMCVDYTSLNLIEERKGSISFAAHRSSSRLDLMVRNPLLP